MRGGDNCLFMGILVHLGGGEGWLRGSLSSWCLAQRPEGESPLLTFPRPTRPDMRPGSRQIPEPQIVGF